MWTRLKHTIQTAGGCWRLSNMLRISKEHPFGNYPLSNSSPLATTSCQAPRLPALGKSNSEPWSCWILGPEHHPLATGHIQKGLNTSMSSPFCHLAFGAQTWLFHVIPATAPGIGLKTQTLTITEAESHEERAVPWARSVARSVAIPISIDVQAIRGLFCALCMTWTFQSVD